MYRLFIIIFAFYTSVLQATGNVGVVGTYWATTFTDIFLATHGSPGIAKQKPVTLRPVLQELVVPVLVGVVKLATLYPKVLPKCATNSWLSANNYCHVYEFDLHTHYLDQQYSF